MNISARQQMCPAEQHAFGHAVTIPADLADEPHASFTSHIVNVHQLPIADPRPIVSRSETARDNWRISRPTTPVATQAEAAAISGNATLGAPAKVAKSHVAKMPGAQREAARQQAKPDPVTEAGHKAVVIVCVVVLAVLACWHFLARFAA